MDLGSPRGDAHPRLALRALYEGSTARVVFGGILTAAVFDIARGIRQGCPSSGSARTLVFEPGVRLLHAHLRGPMDEISVFAGDIAATLARLFVGLPVLLRIFALLSAAAGLAVHYPKTLVINNTGQLDFVVTRRLVDATGFAEIVVARVGLYLGVLIGLEAEGRYWNAAISKFPRCCALPRSFPAPLRQRLVSCRTHASSVLQYLAQFSPLPKVADVIETATLASIAPMHGFSAIALLLPGGLRSGWRCWTTSFGTLTPTRTPMMHSSPGRLLGGRGPASSR